MIHSLDLVRPAGFEPATLGLEVSSDLCRCVATTVGGCLSVQVDTPLSFTSAGWYRKVTDRPGSHRAHIQGRRTAESRPRRPCRRLTGVPRRFRTGDLI